MTEPEHYKGSCKDNESSNLSQPVLVEPTNTNTNDAANNIISELESQITEKDNEIDRLTKLSAKYERLLEKANKYNEDLRNELSVLSSELHKYRSRSFENNTAVHTQVAQTDIEEAYGNKPMPDWGTESDKGLGELSIADCLKAAVEAELQNQENATGSHLSEPEPQKAEAASEYVFDESSGLYFHSATGYYWDPNFGLFYDHSTGTYYQYSETTGEYVVHSRVNMTEQYLKQSETEGNIKKIKNKGQKRRNRAKDGESHDQSAKRKLKRRIRENEVKKIVIIDEDTCDNSEVMKLKPEEKLNAEHSADEKCQEDVTADVDKGTEYDSESSGSLLTGELHKFFMSEPESGELTSESSSSDVEILEMEGPPLPYEFKTEIAEDYPPCIRVIVQSSEHLRCGSLYIITCAGGSIGRDKNRGHAVEIDDINVSKLHAEVSYDYERLCYILRDKGSQNGTILNGNRLSQNKSKSDCHDLHHDDLLQIGSTTFLLHIHKGHETCDSCEPGQVQAKLKAENSIKNAYVVMSQEEKIRQRKKELKNIKKKYGLQNCYYENPGAVSTNPDFCDKAYLRRKFIGSESEFVKQHEEPASAHSPISTQNKGHKLLSKMGWKEGQGLGKSSSGIAEPINVEMRVNQNAGLGSAMNASLSLDNVQHAGRTKRWTQARRRYEKLEANDREAQASVSSQMLSATDNGSDTGSHSHPVPVLPAGLHSRVSNFRVSSSTELHSSASSSLTNDPLNMANETMTTLTVKDVEHIYQTPRSKVHQYSSKMSWVRGCTEQSGQLVPPSNPSLDETENT